MLLGMGAGWYSWATGLGIGCRFTDVAIGDLVACVGLGGWVLLGVGAGWCSGLLNFWMNFSIELVGWSWFRVGLFLVVLVLGWFLVCTLGALGTSSSLLVGLFLVVGSVVYLSLVVL